MAGTVVAVENTEAAVAVGVAFEVAAGVIDGPPVDPRLGCIAGAGAGADDCTHSELSASQMYPCAHSAAPKIKHGSCSQLTKNQIPILSPLCRAFHAEPVLS